MTNEITVYCDTCDFVTDFNLLSSNPTCCPECDSGQLYVDGTEQTFKSWLDSQKETK